MKILVIRFSSIGDIVLTTPVVRCLHEQLGAEVHFLTKANFVRILTPNPNIAKVFSFQKDVSEVLTELKQENYDLIVDLHHNLRSLHVKLSLGKTARSFDKLNFEKWLIVNLGVDRLPAIHIVERYLATVNHLEVTYDGKGLDYFIPEDQHYNLGVGSELVENGVAYVIGATHNTKRSSLPMMIEICKGIRKRVWLLGGPAEANEGEQIAAVSGSHVVNLCGKLTLHQSASVVKQVGKVLTHDTGLMHIAAAFGKDIVSVWGNTIPAFGMYPFLPDGAGQNNTVEVKGLSCRPCSKIGFDRCPKGHFKCMNEISVEKILKLINN